MRKTDVKSLSPWLLRQILNGEPVVVTHKGEDICAVISIETLNLLEGLQLESLEEEDDSAENEIKDILNKISQKIN